MADSRAEQIAALKSLIASHLEQQTLLGLDLTESLTALRAKLFALETGQNLTSANTPARSGGVDVETEAIDVGGSLVGRDQIISNQNGPGGVSAEEIHGGVFTGDGVIYYVANQTVPSTALLSPTARARERYLRILGQRSNVLPLGALGGEEGTSEEIGLDQVYVDLDTRTRVPSSYDGKTPPPDQINFGKGEDRPLSALEAITHTKRLVLLGDPGSGKSTFIRQLTAWLTAKQLGSTSPLNWPNDLLPILVTLRELAPQLARLNLDTLSGDERDRQLLGAVRARWLADLQDLNAVEFAVEQEDALVNERALLIFDGLDEVPEKLRERVRDAIGAVLQNYPKVARVIVTCRIRSYVGNARLPGFVAHTLAPFDETRVRRFVQAWYTAQIYLGRLTKDQALDRTRDLQIAALSTGLRELASNPMLLTTMVIIHQREVGLPRERVRLYSLAVQILLSRWQFRKGFAVSEALAGILSDDDKLRRIMERLAYEAMRQQTQQKEAGNLLRKDILVLLEESAYLGDVALANEFLDYVDQRAGLLIGYGTADEGRKPSEYNFPHRTFQEYLAGCYMVSGRGIEREYRRRLEEGDFWYIAARLGAEELVYNRRSPETLLDLAYHLCPIAEPSTPAAWRAVVWSGQMASVLGTGKIELDTDAVEGGIRYLQRLIPQLVSALEGDTLRPIERTEAGRVLGRLGDPRTTVTQIDHLPFCYIPSGNFIMGGEDEQHLVPHLTYAYWISRYPITNAQFAVFIEAGGYREAAFWPEAEKNGAWKAGRIISQKTGMARERPLSVGEPWNLPNHPVIGVTWYEALAFTRWLTDQLHSTQQLPDSHHLCLPTEAEWEKAAVGGPQIPTVPAIVRGMETPQFHWRVNNLVRRQYPWGNEPDPNRANYYDTKIESTNAVGAFPRGASPYGVLELSGNVWEWTRSLYRQYPYNPHDGREILASADDRVIRGSAFSFNEFSARCAFRGWSDPSRWSDYVGFRCVIVPI